MVHRGPFHWWTLTPMWISDYSHYKMCDEITYPFPNLNTWGMDKLFFPHFTGQVSAYSCQHLKLIDQSGTEPNLVAKLWPPNLVTICAWLPKFVANVSSNFHHLVNTGIVVGSFFKWLPITVAHTCKLEAVWVAYISPFGNGSIRL